MSAIGRVLGLDPGERRIGVALSDPLGMIAQPLAVLDRRRDDVVAEVGEIVAAHGVERVVIGLPVSLRGEEGPAVARARELGEVIARELNVAVEFYDERFTTVQAESALIEGRVRRRERREARDKVAAAIMLQGYLQHPDRSGT